MSAQPIPVCRLHATSGRIQFNGADLATGGNAYNLTKTGNNLLLFYNSTIDTALADVTINQGILGLQGTLPNGMGNSSNTITVNGAGAGQPAGGSILQIEQSNQSLEQKHLASK